MIAYTLMLLNTTEFLNDYLTKRQSVNFCCRTYHVMPGKGLMPTGHVRFSRTHGSPQMLPRKRI